MAILSCAALDLPYRAASLAPGDPGSPGYPAGPGDPGGGATPAPGEYRPNKKLTPAVTPGVDRLAPPPTKSPPSQADLGGVMYTQVCMACHGDRGQGLTDEWRSIWSDSNGDDSYCWASKCHGPSHPPHGFSFPYIVPAVFGPQALTRFDNALELFNYNSQKMPWWSPGYLKREEYWQITAYMMRVQGAMPDGVTLDEHNAAAFHLRPANPLPGDARPQIWLLSGVLVIAAALITVQERLR